MKTHTNFNKTLLNSIIFKTIFSFIALICFTQIGFGQGTETFTDIDTASTSSSISRSWTGDDGSLWAATFSRVDQNINGDALTLDDDRANTYVESGIISGGVGDITISTQRAFSGGSGNIDILINGTSVGLVPYGTSVQTTTIQNVNISGDFVIRIDNNIGGNNGGGADRVIIDDFIWTAFSGTVLPGITLGSMSGNTNEDGTTATFTAVLDAAPAGDVVVDITSGDPGEVTVSPSQLTFTTINWDTPQTITATGVDDSDLDGDIDVTITVAVDDANSDAAYAGISETTTVTNDDDEIAPIPTLIITELADPNNSTVGRYVEIYNAGDASINLSDDGIKLRRYTNEQITFTDLSLTGTIEANSFLVIGKSGFAGVYGFAPDLTTSSFVIDSNGDDQLALVQDDTIFDIFGVVGEEGTTTCHEFEDGRAERVASSKIATDTWNTADWNVWTDNTISGCSNSTNDPQDAPNGFDPGAWIGAPRWDGSTDTDWNTGGNWDTGIVPSSDSDIYINSGLITVFSDPLISSTDAVAQSVTVASGNTLTIDETSSLTVSGDFTNNGTVTLNSTADDFSSLIVEGTATGNVVYNRYVNSYNATAGGGWDGTGPPVAMSIADFITDNTGVIYQVGDTYALGPFNNFTNQYEYYTTTTVPSAGAFTAAKGYTMATDDTNGATVKYTGTIATTSQSIDVINNNAANGGVGRRWNFVSNPFPSYINGNTNAAAVNNFLDVNSGVLDATYTGVYGWNGSTYDIYNLLDGAFSIAPGQGFFVAAASSSDTALDFTPAMRTTNGSGDFVLGPQPLTYYVGLKLYNEQTQLAKTNLYFRDGLSLNLDPGYDAGAFNQSTKLSTRLPQGSQETAFARNAMGMEAMQNTRVPLEIRQNAGQAFSVSIADMNLPEDIYVYLEDTLNGTLTSLKDQDFELVAQSDLSGAERFFIVFNDNSVLSSGDAFGMSALNVYKVNKDNFVTIAGISPDLGQIDVTLYNILGMTVREKALNPTTATQRVSTNGLASGLYVVQLRSANQVFNKKIIVE
ncbi:lamin tail domain-containing protein [bacterium]|nr:lamin tail domain-containing protein [bacterium]